MAEVQYNRYQTLRTFAKHWRNYKNAPPKLDLANFRKNMQNDKYVMMKFYDDEKQRPVYIYLFEKNSKHIKKSDELRKLLSRIKGTGHVILVASEMPKIYGKKVISEYPNLDIKVYLHQNFTFEIPNGPNCVPHRKLSTGEIKNLLNNELYCRLINLPRILDNDIMCIWIGATPGDIIEIKNKTDINGECIQYRLVTSATGKKISFKTQQEPVEESEELDEDIAEYKEDVKTDDEDSEEEESPIIDTS
jgi:DNA-directed RNA polymerase subunit H (RpoH/RPB5)